MYLSQRYSLEDFNEVLDKNNPEVFKIKNKTGEGSFKSYNVFPEYGFCFTHSSTSCWVV